MAIINKEVEHSMSRSGVKITVMRRRTSTDGVLLSSMSCSRNAACASSIRLYHIIGSHISTSTCRISRSFTALLRNMLSTQTSYRQCTADTLTLFRENLRACVSTGWLVGNGVACISATDPEPHFWTTRVALGSRKSGGGQCVLGAHTDQACLQLRYGGHLG